MQIDEKYIAIDFGGTTIKFAVFSNDEIKKYWEIPTKFSSEENSKEEIISDIINDLQKFFVQNDFGINIDNIDGIGLTIPGPVDKDNIVISAPNVFWFTPFDIEEEFKKRLNKKDLVFSAGNDANIAALAENYYGESKNFNSSCLLILGTGLGCGLINNGNIVNGKKGLAGEIGHLFFDDVRYDYKKKSELEDLVSGTGLENIFAYISKSNVRVSAKDIIEMAKNGDDMANKSIDLSFEYLANIISIIDKVYAPEIFVMSGGMSNAGDFIVERINNLLSKYYDRREDMPLIKIAKLMNKAGVYGAYTLVKHKNKNRE